MQAGTAQLPAMPRVGFVAAHAPGLDVVAMAAQYCRNSSHALVTGPYPGRIGAAVLRASCRDTAVIADVGDWRSRSASVAEPTSLSGGLQCLDVDAWTAAVAVSTGASAVLTPSLHIGSGSWRTLQAVLEAAAQATDPRAVPFIPIDAGVLDRASLRSLLKCLAPVRGRPLAFTFTGPAQPLADKSRLAGLRALLARHPEAWILGVDPLVATDALAHGAALAAVGTGSSTRRPAGPGDKARGGFSLGYLPGMLYVPLLEHRSPAKLADWFANRPLGTCPVCGLNPDALDGVAGDRAAIISHNLHATGDLIAEVLARPATQRADYLTDRRNDALARHVSLTPLAMPVDADLTLRALCELDDARGRVTTPQGAWC